MNGCETLKCTYWDGKLCSSPLDVCVYQDHGTISAAAIDQIAALKAENERLKASIRICIGNECKNNHLHYHGGCFSCDCRNAISHIDGKNKHTDIYAKELEALAPPEKE